MKNKVILVLITLFSVFFLGSVFKLSDDIQRKDEILENKAEVLNVTDSIKTMALVTEKNLPPEMWAKAELATDTWKEVKIPEYKMIQEPEFKEGHFGIYRITIPKEEIEKLKQYEGQIEFNPQYILFSDFDIYVNGKFLRSNSPTTGSESITGIPLAVGMDNLVSIKGRIKNGDTGIQHRGKIFLGKAATLNELHLSAYKGNYVFPLLFILSKGSVIFVFGLIYLLLNVERFFEKSLLFSLCAIGEDILTGDFLASMLTINSRVYIYNLLNIGANLFLFLFLADVVGKTFKRQKIYFASILLGFVSYAIAADILHTAYLFTFNIYLQFWNYVSAGVIIYYLPKVFKQDKILFFIMSSALTLTMWSTLFGGNVGLNYKMLGNLLLFFMVAYQSFALFRREQLQLVEQEKDVAIGRTASLLAHDVRRPLEQMRLLLAKVSSGDISKNFLDAAKSDVDFSITSVNNQINEIMNYSKTRPVELTPISFYRVLSGSLKQVMTINKHLNIAIDYDFLAPVKIMGDESRLASALTNLISNAVEAIRDLGKKDSGTIRLSTRMEHNRFVFQIFNDGPVIPQNILEEIFKPLFTSGKERGTGLGLASVMKTVQDHKGSISVRNVNGNGVEFTMILSGTLIPDRAEDYQLFSNSQEYSYEVKEAPVTKRPLRIFLLDDDVQVHEYFQYLIKNLPFEVELTFVTHYESAREAALAKRYDLYILDYDLGSSRTGLNFYQEHLSFLGEEVVIHSNRDKVDFENYNFNHLKKPMSFDELSCLCEDSYKRRMKILLVDDGQLTLMAWEMFHGRHNIHLADSPEEALKFIRSGTSKVDLCILDYYYDNSSINGEALALQMRAVQNELRIVLASNAELETSAFPVINKHQFEVRSLK